MKNSTARQTVASSLLVLSRDGDAYLRAQQIRHLRAFGRAIGRSTICRGIVDGFQQSGFAISGFASEYDIAGAVRNALLSAQAAKVSPAKENG